MQRAIILFFVSFTTRREYPSLTNVGTVCLLDRVVHAVHLLLITDKVFDSRNDTLFLNTFNCLPSPNSLENMVGAETLPVATALGLAADGAYCRAKPDIDALAAGFLAYGDAALVHELFVKGGAHGDAVGEDSYVVCLSHAIGSVVETELREVEARD